MSSSFRILRRGRNYTLNVALALIIALSVSFLLSNTVQAHPTGYCGHGVHRDLGWTDYFREHKTVGGRHMHKYLHVLNGLTAYTEWRRC